VPLWKCGSGKGRDGAARDSIAGVRKDERIDTHDGSMTR